MWNIEKIVKKGDYLYAVVSGHPFSTEYGYVLHHRIVMENHLNRLLSADEIVHHVNGNTKDNRIENLQVMLGKDHVSMHGLLKGKKMCRLKCPECGEFFDRPKRQTFLQKGSQYTCCSAACRGRFSRSIQLNGLTAEVERAISVNLVFEYNSNDNTEQTVKRQDA